MVLTLENAGALVAGKKQTKEEIMEFVTVVAKRGFYWERKLVKPGEKIRVPKIFAIEACASNKAERIDLQTEENPELGEKSNGMKSGASGSQSFRPGGHSSLESKAEKEAKK